MTPSSVVFFVSCGAGSRCLFLKGKRGFGVVKGKVQKNFVAYFGIVCFMGKPHYVLPDAALLAVLQLALVQRERWSYWLEGGWYAADPRPLQRG